MHPTRTPITHTVVIGAGQAGLATSRCLTEAGRDHVVLERGHLAERWRSERWDSLRLLTPNWMTRLPGWSYRGDDPEGFMTATEVVDFFEGYARSFAPPVHQETSVEAVDRVGDRYRVRTDQGSWWAENVVVATGHCGHPLVPAAARSLPAWVHQLTSDRYRNPSQLPAGGVLVVGGSATGLQLAEELARAGRDVVLAVGEHTRMPRRYRGRDICWWLDRTGSNDASIDDHPDPAAARRSPSMQLVGSAEGRDLDLGTAQAAGVRLAGHLTGIDGPAVTFADDLDDAVARSEQRMHRTLDRIDRCVELAAIDAFTAAPDRPAPIHLRRPLERLDLRAAGIGTVLWATGFGRSYPWLRVPVTDGRGEIRHRQGRTAAPGLYVVGLRFQHHRNSNFIDGVGRDARSVVSHLIGRPATTEEVAA